LTHTPKNCFSIGENYESLKTYFEVLFITLE
jgi:hypothetical protein